MNSPVSELNPTCVRWTGSYGVEISTFLFGLLNTSAAVNPHQLPALLERTNDRASPKNPPKTLLIVLPLSLPSLPSLSPLGVPVPLPLGGFSHWFHSALAGPGPLCTAVGPPHPCPSSANPAAAAVAGSVNRLCCPPFPRDDLVEGRASARSRNELVRGGGAGLLGGWRGSSTISQLPPSPFPLAPLVGLSSTRVAGG